MVSVNAGKPRFGVDIDAELLDWWYEEYLPELRRRHGDDINVATVVLDPMMYDLLDWERSLAQELYRLVSGDRDSEVFAGEVGLVANIGGKLAFVLRTGLDSLEAEKRPDLVEPGDFPWEGAGTYRGYKGGTSGLAKESDWRVFMDVVDKTIELRAAAAQTPLASWDRLPDAGPSLKYLTAEWEVVDGVQRPVPADMAANG